MPMWPLDIHDMDLAILHIACIVWCLTPWPYCCAMRYYWLFCLPLVSSEQLENQLDISNNNTGNNTLLFVSPPARTGRHKMGVTLVWTQEVEVSICWGVVTAGLGGVGVGWGWLTGAICPGRPDGPGRSSSSRLSGMECSLEARSWAGAEAIWDTDVWPSALAVGWLCAHNVFIKEVG